MSFRSRCATEVLLLILAVLVSSSKADRYEFSKEHGLALVVVDPPGVIEPAVPIYHNNADSPIQGHNHQVIEAFDRVPGTDSYPLTFVDLAANTYLRLTYQKPDGTSGELGTSVVGSPSYRTAEGFKFIPTVNSSDVTTSGEQRYKNVITANFGSAATVSSTRIFPDPVIGRSTVELSIIFETQENILLSSGDPFADNDRLRLLTISSMFASPTQFDGDELRYESPGGAVKQIILTDSTPRSRHLLPTDDGPRQADEIGDWFEVIQGPGDTWSPESPSIRVDILDRDGLSLGIQGWLDSSTDPNSDSLNVYLEVLGKDSLPAGTRFDVSFRITAVPEPSTLSLLTLGLLCLLAVGARRRR